MKKNASFYSTCAHIQSTCWDIKLSFVWLEEESSGGLVKLIIDQYFYIFCHLLTLEDNYGGRGAGIGQGQNSRMMGFLD